MYEIDLFQWTMLIKALYWLWYFILRSFFIHHQVFYKLNWENYSSNESSWEPAENLIECDELIEKYDEQQVHEVLGAKQSANGDILYLLKYKDEKPNRTVPSSEAIGKWPDKVLKYLETIAHMASVRGVNFPANIVETNQGGNPIRVGRISLKKETILLE